MPKSRRSVYDGLPDMKPKIALYWPGDARSRPNELALPNIQEATVQLERALRKLGREPYRIDGFLSRPHEAIEKLGPIADPLVGVCVHWLYGLHTTPTASSPKTPRSCSRAPSRGGGRAWSGC